MSDNLHKSEWKVYFNGSFWTHRGRDHAGKEIAIRQAFLWGEEEWFLPALYICGKGIVMDFCKKVSVEEIQNFMDKWNFRYDDTYCKFSRDDQMLIDAENPFNTDLRPQLFLNRCTADSSAPDSHLARGSAISSQSAASRHFPDICAPDKCILGRKNSYGLTWNPCLPEDMRHCEPEAKALLTHYGLDPACGWCFRRITFPWTTSRKPAIRSLCLHVSQNPVNLPGPHFNSSAPGDTFCFTHPTTGVTHTLTVQEWARQEFEQKHFGSGDYLYPTHTVSMTYTLSPDLSGTSFTVLDCAESDDPRRKPTENDPLRQVLPEATCSAAAISIIGGADGPTSILLGGHLNRSSRQTDGTGDDNADTVSAPLPLHAACSALHFEPVDDVTWRLLFLVKTKEDIEIPITLP